MRYLLLLFSVFLTLICSCKQRKHVAITSLRGLTFDGCSCSFFPSAKNIEKEGCYFVSDYDSNAMISVDDIPVKLNLTGTNKNKENLDSIWIDTFSNEKYRVIIRLSEKDNHWEESETIDFTGDIRVEEKKEIIFSGKIEGACGC